jgi:hypothetical protein
MIGRAVDEEGGVSVTALLCFGAALLLFLVVDLVKERVRGGYRFRVAAMDVIVVGARPPLTPSAREVLGAGPPLLDQPRSTLDPELTSVLRSSLLERPWVRDVLEVRRQFPDEVSIRVTLREPVAVVRQGKTNLPVDDEGTVLDATTRLGPPRLPLITIPGAPLEAFPEPGGRFPPRGEVAEALAALRELRHVRTHPALMSLRIDEVRVGAAGRPRNPGDSDIHFICDTGLRLLWGRSPASPLRVIEPEATQKLDHLDRVQTLHPGLVGVSLVDLSLGQPEITYRQ